MPRKSLKVVTIRRYYLVSRNPGKFDGILAGLNLMPHNLRRRWVVALLSAAVMLALTVNAMATAFCSHLNGGQCCVKTAPAPSGQSANPEHHHNHHAEMSDMDTSDAAMDMSEVQTARDNVESESILPAGIEQTGEAITQPVESCFHCLIHSQTNSNNSSRVAIENRPANPTIVGDAPAPFLIPSSPNPRFVEVHDHGPPGLSAPLYVLVSSFRI